MFGVLGIMGWVLAVGVFGANPALKLPKPIPGRRQGLKTVNKEVVQADHQCILKYCINNNLATVRPRSLVHIDKANQFITEDNSSWTYSWYLQY